MSSGLCTQRRASPASSQSLSSRTSSASCGTLARPRRPRSPGRKQEDHSQQGSTGPVSHPAQHSTYPVSLHTTPGSLSTGSPPQPAQHGSSAPHHAWAGSDGMGQHGHRAAAPLAGSQWWTAGDAAQQPSSNGRQYGDGALDNDQRPATQKTPKKKRKKGPGTPPSPRRSSHKPSHMLSCSRSNNTLPGARLPTVHAEPVHHRACAVKVPQEAMQASDAPVLPAHRAQTT